MRFYQLDGLGDPNNQDFCFTDKRPKGVSAYKLKQGARLSDAYPDGIGDVTLQLGEDNPGLMLPDFVGNTNQLLICTNAVKDAVLAHDTGEIEVVPFVLLNHRGREHSRDFVFLNPVGTVDCLNLSACDLWRHDDGSLGGIDTYVLDAGKVANARDLFRPVEDPGEYFFSEKLVSALREKGFTNFVFHDLEVK